MIYINNLTKLPSNCKACQFLEEKQIGFVIS